MTVQNTGVQNVFNYMVPAAGQTHAVTFSGAFSATPFLIDWRQFSVDNFPFVPQGVFIDNTQGTGPLTITIFPLGFNVVCPTGSSGQFQFPAPNGQTAQIVGNGQATVYFVDFPVLPNGAQVTLAGSPNVTIAGATNAASPVSVIMPPNSQGLAYQVQPLPLAVTTEYLALTTTTSATLTPPAGTFLRSLDLHIASNSVMTTAGNNAITVTLNGVQIVKVSPYIPATITNIARPHFYMEFEFDSPPVGSGTLVLSSATALTSGIIELNAYFG